MKYKNLSMISRQFYGVVIKPGEVKDFPGYVNAPRIVRVRDEIVSEKKSNIDSHTDKTYIISKENKQDTNYSDKKNISNGKSESSIIQKEIGSKNSVKGNPSDNSISKVKDEEKENVQHTTEEDTKQIKDDKSKDDKSKDDKIDTIIGDSKDKKK